jgi:hypothetical protein
LKDRLEQLLLSVLHKADAIGAVQGHQDDFPEIIFGKEFRCGLIHAITRSPLWGWNDRIRPTPASTGRHHVLRILAEAPPQTDEPAGPGRPPNQVGAMN